MDAQTHGEKRKTRPARPSGREAAIEELAFEGKALSDVQLLLVELQLQNQELRAARDQAELALARFTDLYDSAPVGYLSLRRDGSIRDVNLTGARLLGMSRAKLRNAHFAGFVHGDDQPALVHFARQVFGERARGRCELTLLPAEDRPPLVAHLEARCDDTGLECRITITDITERRRAEDERRRAEQELRAAKVEAERANAAKSRFLAAASHDLRQPLSALSLYAGTLEDALPAEERGLARNMKRCVAGLNELLSDLLDLSKLEAGVMKPTICNFPLDSVLGKVLASLEPKARRKHLALRYRYFGRFCRTDPVMFRRIVGNLVSNAVRYTERGGVLIGVRRRQGKTWLEVWDTGIGIPADKTAEVFEEFTRIDRPGHDDREPGAGLGLAIVAKEAALLGLELRVRSVVGKGSMFAVELPPGEAVPAVPAHIERQRPLCIAVVERNAEVARALSYALLARGHQPIVANSRQAIMASLGDRAPDIVVCEYRLGGTETGYDVIAALRTAFGAALPAMLITGDTDPALMRRMAKTGIAVQHKPLNTESFCNLLAELTDRRSGAR
ncbi:MAG TPA: ATP-binding protein [Rhodocyclaceae bacterium]